jgi:phosphopantothenoylcysteine synthetase/decarboxylase
MRHAALRGKKVLVTAGPTWVALDPVRVISNVSTGNLGILLAREAVRLGAKVDLFLGPVGDARIPSGASVRRFTYFDDLRGLLKTQLKKRRYDIILHAAAVSDYQARKRPGKISSEKKELVIRLTRAPKLIALMRQWNPVAFLVMFKLESGVSDAALIERGRKAMKKVKADLVVANRVENGGYRGFILDEAGAPACCANRARLAERLFFVLKDKINL